jgi:hypothetical protein
MRRHGHPQVLFLSLRDLFRGECRVVYELQVCRLSRINFLGFQGIHGRLRHLRTRERTHAEQAEEEKKHKQRKEKHSVPSYTSQSLGTRLVVLPVCRRASAHCAKTGVRHSAASVSAAQWSYLLRADDVRVFVRVHRRHIVCACVGMGA